MTTATLSTAEPEPAATTATSIESSIPNQTEPAETTPDKPMPALVVFGTDKDGKPHASAFTHADAALATKAAGVMGMRVLTLETDDHRALAAELPAGRVFGSGRAFVPFVKKGLYERLSALAGPAAGGGAVQGETATHGAATATGDTDEQGFEGPGVGEPRYPRSWAGIAVGSLVLIWGGADDGWYEAEILEAKAGGLFTLRWRDWPELPVLVRRRENMALLHPNTAAAEAA